MSKSETYIFTTRGRWCFFPAFKCFPWRSALPDREMSLVSNAARKVARLLWCLHASLPEASHPNRCLLAVIKGSCRHPNLNREAYTLALGVAGESVVDISVLQTWAAKFYFKFSRCAIEKTRGHLQHGGKR